jgi:hypothetical protein
VDFRRVLSTLQDRRGQEENKGELKESAGGPIEKVSDNKDHIISDFEDLLE